MDRVIKMAFCQPMAQASQTTPIAMPPSSVKDASSIKSTTMIPRLMREKMVSSVHGLDLMRPPYPNTFVIMFASLAEQDTFNNTNKFYD